MLVRRCGGCSFVDGAEKSGQRKQGRGVVTVRGIGVTLPVRDWMAENTVHSGT